VRVTAADGTQLDAAFDLEGQTYGADLILPSRSGSKTKNTRNPDYFAALEEILRRIGGLGATISSIHIDSSVALQLPAAARRLQLDYPLRPADAPDIAALRREITQAQRTVARTDTTLGTCGNNHKRIRISIELAEHARANARAPQGGSACHGATLGAPVHPRSGGSDGEARRALHNRRRRGRTGTGGTRANPELAGTSPREGRSTAVLPGPGRARF
jgi:hypothetical protein